MAVYPIFYGEAVTDKKHEEILGARIQNVFFRYKNDTIYVLFEMVRGIIEFMKEIGMTPKIGAITGAGYETYRRRKEIKTGVVGFLNKTYRQAQKVVAYFKKRGFEAKNYAIELGTAVEEGCNIIVPPCGMVGNQIFRALCRIGGGKVLIASRYGLPHVYEDNSRTEKDFEFHIK